MTAAQGQSKSTIQSKAPALWCGLPPLQTVLLIVFGLALLSVFAFTITLDRGSHPIEPRKTIDGKNTQLLDATERKASIFVNDNNKMNLNREFEDGSTAKAAPIVSRRAEEPNKERPSAVTQSALEGFIDIERSLAAIHALPLEGPSSLKDKRERELHHFQSKKDTGGFDIHFIHIPKCGGTSMTGILRQVRT